MIWIIIILIGILTISFFALSLMRSAKIGNHHLQTFEDGKMTTGQMIGRLADLEKDCPGQRWTREELLYTIWGEI